MKVIECAGIGHPLACFLSEADGVFHRDAVTPNQDWIISAHPRCKGLYIAAGGSFHSWKFMPILGHYVVQMLQGKLDEEPASRWAWDRSNDGGAMPEYFPRRDLKDIPGYIQLSSL